MPAFHTKLPPSGRGLRVLDSYNQNASAIEGRDHILDASSSSSGSSSPLIGNGANAQSGSSTDILDIFLPPPTTPSPRAKKHHGRRQEPGHVPRPMNAFFIFRSKFSKDNRGSGKGQQNQLSKMAGEAWRAKSKAERQEYHDEAERQKAILYETYPEYHYSPKRKRGASKLKAAKATVARSRVPLSSAATSRSASVRSARATPQVTTVASSSSSSSSNVTYTPERLFPCAAPAPHHAAPNTVQCYEWMASLSSPRTPGSPANSMASSSYPASSYPSSPQILPYSQFPPLFNPTINPTTNIPAIARDPAPQTLHVDEGSKDEPIFVSGSPPRPTRRFCEEPQHGYNAYNAYLPSQLTSTDPSVVPFSTTMSAVSSSDLFCQWGMPAQPAVPDLDYMGYSMPEDLAASEHALMQMGYGGGYDDFLTAHNNADAAEELQFDMSAYVDGWTDI